MYAAMVKNHADFKAGLTAGGRYIPGTLAWFDSLPDNMLKEQKELYGDVLDIWFRNKEMFLSTGFNIHFIAEKLRQIFHARTYGVKWK